MSGGVAAGPRERVKLVFDSHRHQAVPRRVVLDLVDAVAVTVVAVEHRLVLVREASPLLLRVGADELAERRGALERPAGALALGGLD